MPNIKKLLADLKTQYNLLYEEREALRPTWQQLADQFVPLKRPVLEEGNTTEQLYQQYGELNDNILDATPVNAVKVTASGMQGGMTSPSQRWFKLGHANPEIDKSPNVKEWLEDVQNVMFSVMAASNYYNANHEMYTEIPVFGTAVKLTEENEEEVIRCTVLTIGHFLIGEDSKGNRTTIYRDIVMTAEQIVDKFGFENASVSVQVASKDVGTSRTKYTVIHAILPNTSRIPDKIDAANKLFSSIYYERDSVDKVLRISGFDTQPFVAPRWGVVDHNTYGVSPAMDMLPFAKQLQDMTLTLLEALQKEVDPPLNAPPSAKEISLLPGAINEVQDSAQLVPTISVKSSPQNTSVVIDKVKAEIREGFFNDLFKALALAPNARMTATEVRERVVEGLRLLGPVLERLQHEFLSPDIDRVFDICLRRGLFPEVPEELEGVKLDVTYISPLARAQKAEGTATLNQFIAFIGSVQPIDPTIVDNVDFDALARNYADLLGVSPKIIESKEEVETKRELRAEAQRIQVQQESEAQAVNNAKQLSETDTGGGTNALQLATQGAA